MIWRILLCASLLIFPCQIRATGIIHPSISRARWNVETILQKMIATDSPSHQALAIVWDGNAYIQCRRNPTLDVRCEAAGALMQSSLRFVLTPARVNHLDALGWKLDSSFGNYVKTFPNNVKMSRIAAILLTSLRDGYGVNPADLEFENTLVARAPCPPRNGPSQNLAGSINDAKEMASVALHACVYTPATSKAVQLKKASLPRRSAAQVILSYRVHVVREVKRLRQNSGHKWVFAALQTDVGYVQCESIKGAREIDCEAQSAESEPSLAGILKPDRVARLHSFGFALPGLRQNYYRRYKATASDAKIADALLTILHDIYGYDGSSKLKVYTEAGERDLL